LKTIASPCVKICTVDPERDICNGCHRTLDEIARWSDMSDAERAQVLALLPARRRLVKTLAD
jgi:predicted Fe-S protein YdhL (DUF1289 family)